MFTSFKTNTNWTMIEIWLISNIWRSFFGDVCNCLEFVPVSVNLSLEIWFWSIYTELWMLWSWHRQKTITISLRSSNKLARNRKRRMAKPVERLFDPAEVRSIMMKRHVNICISDQPILSEKSLLIENCSVSKFHEKLDYFSWNLFDHILKLHANFSKWTDSKQQALE